MINIIIVNYESSQQVFDCVNRLQSKNHRFLIVDNSLENTDLLKSLNNVVYLSPGYNSGYAAGNNYAFQYIRDNNLHGPIFILNPDVIIDVSVIAKMEKILNSNETIGQVYCSAKNENGKTLYNVIKLNGLNQNWELNNKGVLDSDYAAGSAMLINSDAVDGYLFDEKYFLYWEEVDLSLRIKRNGFRVVVDCDESCIRSANAIERQISAIYYLTRNSFLIKSKFNQVSNYDMVVYQAKMLLICARTSLSILSLQVFRLYFKALRDALRNQYGVRK